MDSSIYVHNILNTTMVVVYKAMIVVKKFHNSDFLKQVYVIYESILERVPNNAKKSC